MKTSGLTHQRLIELLTYRKKTGLFMWRIFRGGRAKKGSIAGCRDKDGYVRVQVEGKNYLASRLAWFYVKGVWPSNQIDHEDLCEGNNSWANLREATHTQNRWNTPKRVHNTSGFKGVHRHTGTNKYYARIRVPGKRIFLGSFSTPEAAHEAYALAAVKFHGQFARAS